MTTTISTPPTDPESAALDLLVEAAETAAGSTAFRAVLQDLAGALQIEGALAGLAWVDARLVAVAIAYDALTDDDPVVSLRMRACRLLGSALRQPRGHCPGARRRRDHSGTGVSGFAPRPLCYSGPDSSAVAGERTPPDSYCLITRLICSAATV